MELTSEKGYDKVTVEDITERANLGRTTFYLHYQSKDDLLVDHHNNVAEDIRLGEVSAEALLETGPRPAIVTMLSQLKAHPAVYAAFTTSKDAALIRHKIVSDAVERLVAGFDRVFPGQEPAVPAGVLAEHLVRSQMAMMDWWIQTSTGYTAEQCAAHIQWLRSTAIAAAYDTGVFTHSAGP